MLGVLCARPKSSWLLSLFNHGGAASFHHRLTTPPPLFKITLPRRHHSTTCNLQFPSASIWHAILPSGLDPKRGVVNLKLHHNDCYDFKGEGSWNAAWDVRPARWLHNPDSGWLLFGVCGCLASPQSVFGVIFDGVDQNLEGVCKNDQVGSSCLVKCGEGEVDQRCESNYKVKGVPADGRCLFRAIAHMACLRNGEEAPDENRQRELADELRAQVVDELLRRREEAEWFIEGDFDAYVKRIQQPYVWGGEPELLMASHVLKVPISVFMSDRSSGELTKIANYGEDYKNDDESPINVLFHGYGHYDILEIVDQSHQKLKVKHKMR